MALTEGRRRKEEIESERAREGQLFGEGPRHGWDGGCPRLWTGRGPAVGGGSSRRTTLDATGEGNAAEDPRRRWARERGAPTCVEGVRGRGRADYERGRRYRTQGRG